ncbi:hypothetical protein [Methylobacterium sp. 13MFTsu3.1M2]|uniref:hypothetical protein n=1 Tax=Methylobacterium sp. 13MFTsu3.1M2 TaxID=1502776 RepID=UPI0008F01CD0|nr:hypothetical protein [Methylobacterium sp. 13MFTsu3.1M2]SFE09727.1 hypothetical protein SAMN02799627_02547 [Methylobacterium sp. 13MFTsu3.1M2]
MFALDGFVRWSLPFLLVVAHEARAEPSKNDPQACVTITKAADRLACFDRAFAKPSVPAPTPVDLRALVTKDRQCDLQALHAAIVKAVPPKSDYETSEAFAERGRRQLAAAGIPYSSIFCRSNNLPLRYDADKGGYKIDGMFPTKSLYSQEGNRRVFTYWNGDNQLGMTPIALVPAATAEKLGSNAADGAILELVSPFVSQYTSEDSPGSTKDAPETSVGITLHFEPRYVFLYNSVTYEILWSRPVLRCDSSGYILHMIDACSPGAKRLN